jgi:hypothetical protein
MNFLNPAYLFALAAVAIPILIHIFTRRRVPEVPWSSIRFLRPADRRSMVRINLRRLLLLALRVGGVALIALAFARPVVRGALAVLFPAGGSRAVCVLLDRSYSMGLEGEGGTAFERAKVRLQSVLGSLSDRDRVTVVLFDTGTEVVYEGDADAGAIAAALEEEAPSWRGTDLRHAVAFARRSLEESRREVRELYLLSDFQRSGLGAPGTAGVAPRAPVRALLLPIECGDEANAAIEEAATPRAALHRGETAAVSIVISNRAADREARFPIEVTSDGRRVMEKEIAIPPGGALSETAVVPAERAGWIEGIVRKRADRLSADDARFFTLRVRDRARVLLVADEASLYIEQALAPAGADGDIVLAKRGSRTFTTADLSGAEAVVIGPGSGLEATDAELVRRFVEEGGTAVVLVLPELVETVERLSRRRLAIEFADMPQGYFTIARPEPPPPFLAPFDDEDLEALSRVRVRRAAFVEGVPEEEVRLAFSTGAPFVWEERVGGGAILFACLDPRPAAGELVLSPFFLPLMQQMVLSAGPERPAEAGVLVGEPILWPEEARGDVVVELPGGARWKPAVGSASAEAPGGISIPPAEQPGFVRILAGESIVGAIAVNPDCRLESDLSPFAADEAADSLGLEHRMVIGEERDIAAAVGAAREGREITLPLLLAAIAVFAAELVVAQWSRNEGEAGRVG